MAATTASTTTTTEKKPAAKKATKKSTRDHHDDRPQAGREEGDHRPQAGREAHDERTTEDDDHHPQARDPEEAAAARARAVVLLEDAGYAYVGLVGDVVELAKGLPARVEKLRDESVDAAEEVPSLLKATPRMIEHSLAAARERAQKEAERYLAKFEKVFDKKAAEGRKLAEEVKSDERVAAVLRQTENTSQQIRGAVTSVTKTPQVAVDAAHDQAEIAKSQTKAAVTTTRNSVKDIKSSAKAAATSVLKTRDVALHAAEEQARSPRARSRAPSPPPRSRPRSSPRPSRAEPVCSQQVTHRSPAPA
jgi:hypothetical protein